MKQEHMAFIGMRRKLLHVGQAFHTFLHMSALFLSLLFPLLGTVNARGRIAFWQLLPLGAIGVSFHVFAYILNDCIDLPLDRTHPSRSNDPLVKGTIKPWVAFSLVVVQLPLAFIFLRLLTSNCFAFFALGAAFCFMGIYDIWGKRCAFPPLTDLSQGMGWAMLALMGTMISRLPVFSVINATVFLFIVTFFLLSNGIHGSLKDLSNDLKNHRKTSALFWGARPGTISSMLPLPLKLYGSFLQVLLICLLFIPLIRNNPIYSQPERSIIILVVSALVLLSLGWPLRIIRSKRNISQVAFAGMIHLGFSLIGLLALCIPFLQPEILLVLILLYLCPLLSITLLRRGIGNALHLLLTIPKRRQEENAV